ncbi:MAG: MCP four helix bundle domain-containing protein [Nonlabens sp.]|uniref:MCP four helix bundle domain-containing protein n=1 Tax=Nonlabens sp. TaxID=1888209 RepID=UPI00321920B6
MIGNKIKWSVGLILVILLIVATNFIDRNNFQRIQDSVYSIYEDRLIAKDYIFDIQLQIHEKELLLADKNDSIYFSKRSVGNKEIANLIDGFSNTTLIREEKRVFANLKEEVDALFKMEATYLNNSNKTPDASSLKSQLNTISNSLSDLSDIQIAEGKRQMQVGKKAIESVELLTQLEIWIMVVLGIIVQFIILYNPKKD